jgi:hypothetical protein
MKETPFFPLDIFSISSPNFFIKGRSITFCSASSILTDGLGASCAKLSSFSLLVAA